jgi:hypothetical protein
VEGVAVVSALATRLTSSVPMSAAAAGSTFFMTTEVSPGTDLMTQWSISRRAPMIPSPMPVAER